MNKSNGVSMMVVVITVIVMSILVGIITISGSSIINSTNKSKFESEVIQIQSLIKTYKARQNGQVDFEEVTISFNNLTDKEKIQYSQEAQVGGEIVLYEVDLNKIDASEVNYGTKSTGPKDRYLFSLETNKVYYEKGVIIGNEVYHTIID